MIKYRIIRCFSLFAILAILLTGCALISTPYAILIDPLIPRMPKPAEHSIKGKTVLIWVEDYSPQEKNALLRRELTRYLQQELNQNKAGAQLIEYAQLNQFRILYPEHGGMDITEIGRHFKADEIIHLVIDKFQSQHDAGPGYYRVDFIGWIRVLDATDGKRLWPEAEVHYPLAYGGKLSEGAGAEFEDRLVREAAREIAAQIAVAFYPLDPKKQS